MKKYKLLFYFCCILFSGFAQESSEKSSSASRGWTSFTIGMAVPTGSYGQKDVSNDEAGLAKIGLSCKMDIAVGGAPNGGLMISIIGFSNNIDEDVLLGSAASSPNYSITSTSWNAASVLAGLYVQTTIKDKRPSFFGKVQGGYAITRSPSYNLSLQSGGKTIVMKQGVLSSDAWVFDAGCGMNVPLGSTYMFNVGVDYIFMTSDFKEDRIAKPVNPATSYGGSFRMSMSNLLFQAGIAWRM